MFKTSIAAMAFTLAAAGAMAQNATTQNDMEKTNPSANATTTPPAMANPAPAPKPNLVMPSGTPNFISVQSDNMLSSNVVGLDVYNDQNNDIGKIQDIVFDNSKKMTGYIVSVGGFLGMGTRYVGVDPQLREGDVRHKQQGLARDHEREQGPTQGGDRVQIRRIDGTPAEADAPRLKQEEDGRGEPTPLISTRYE